MKTTPIAAFLFIDLETTGLDPETDQIIQIGARAVDKNLNNLAEFEKEAYVFPTLMHFKPGDIAYNMHEKSGLLGKIENCDRTEEGLFLLFRTWAWEQLPLFTTPVILAGSSVHFDRGFLAQRLHLGSLPLKFSHRMLDVSALKVWFNAAHPETAYPKGEPAHTALADIDASIKELKYYNQFIATGVQDHQRALKKVMDGETP